MWDLDVVAAASSVKIFGAVQPLARRARPPRPGKTKRPPQNKPHISFEQRSWLGRFFAQVLLQLLRVRGHTEALSSVVVGRVAGGGGEEIAQKQMQ